MKGKTQIDANMRLTLIIESYVLQPADHFRIVQNQRLLLIEQVHDTLCQTY